MKKKILASLLLSTVLVSQGAVLSSVKANTTDEKIAAQNSKISNLTAQNKQTKFKLKFQLFNQSKKNYNLKTKNFKKNLKNLKVKSQSFQKILQLVMHRLKTKLVVHKRTELLQATSIRLLTLTQLQKLFLVQQL